MIPRSARFFPLLVLVALFFAVGCAPRGHVAPGECPYAKQCADCPVCSKKMKGGDCSCKGCDKECMSKKGCDKKKCDKKKCDKKKCDMKKCDAGKCGANKKEGCFGRKAGKQSCSGK